MLNAIIIPLFIMTLGFYYHCELVSKGLFENEYVNDGYEYDTCPSEVLVDYSEVDTEIDNQWFDEIVKPDKKEDEVLW